MPQTTSVINRNGACLFYTSILLYYYITIDLIGLKNLIWWFLFNFCLNLKFKKHPFCVYRSQWNVKTLWKKTCFLSAENQWKQSMWFKRKLNIQFKSLCLATFCNRKHFVIENSRFVFIGIRPKGYFNFSL